jgi:AraC-like DNA-binding protein
MRDQPTAGPARTNSKQPFIVSNIVRGLQPYLRLSDDAWEDWLADIGLTPQTVALDGALLPMDRAFAAFEAAAVTARNPTLGIDYAAAFSIGGTGPLGFATISARNVREALKTLARFIPLLASKRRSSFEVTKGVASISWEYQDCGTPPSLHYVTWGVAVIMQRLASSLPEGWRPLRLHLNVAPPMQPARFKEYFGDGLSFGPGVHRFEIAADLLDLPLQGANPRLFELMTKLAEIDRQRLGVAATAFEADVLGAISRMIREGRTTVDDLAGELGVPRADLQKELKRHDLNFRNLLDHVRTEAARNYLLESNLSITEIAFALGYPDSSMFTRACHKWFKQTPRDVRNRVAMS